MSLVSHRAAAEPVRPAGHGLTKRLEVRQPILTDGTWKRSARSPMSRAPISSRARSTPPSMPASARRGWSRCSTNPVRAPKARCAKASTSSSRPTAWRVRPTDPRLACAVHHHLIRTGLRTSSVSSSIRRAARSTPFACLAGYGAEAINPYLAFETIIAMKDRLPGALDDYEIVKRHIKSIGKGLLKVMSKMASRGISILLRRHF